MKTTRIISIFLLGACCLLLSNCGLQKMVKKQDTVTYTVKPDPLETHGKKMTFEIQGTFPQKYFNKKATLTIVPTLEAESGAKVALKPIVLKGEKAEGEGQVVSYKQGGNFTYSQTIDYKPEYLVSTLKGDAVAKSKKKEAKFNDFVLAEGTNATSERVSTKATPAYKDQSSGTSFVYTDHGYKGPQEVEKEAYIYFEWNKDNLNWNVALNKKEENKTMLKEIIPFMDQFEKLISVNIIGWASPEGELKRNNELSSNRSKVGQKWFASEYDKHIKARAKEEKVKAEEIKKEITYNLEDKGEDWDGFINTVAASDIKDKNQIVNVIKSQSDIEQRQDQIRNMIAIYNEIDADILPGLRRAIIKVVCLENKRTDEEMLSLASTDPSVLKNEELLYAASLTNDMAKKEEIYAKTVELYPNDYRAYNDLGCIKASNNDLAQAEDLFNKANSLNPNNGIILNNLGVLALMNGKDEQAKNHFEASQKAGFSQNYNIGVINMKAGNYQAAAEKFSNTKCDYNVALNQILMKDYSAAKTTLNCIENKEAEDFYLTAILGARTSDANLLYDNLAKACQANPVYKVQAAKDVEFKKYKDSSEFKNAVK